MASSCFANKCKLEQIAAASPFSYVNHNDAPMLLSVGKYHTTVPYQQTQEMAQELQSAGVNLELIVLPDINYNCIINVGYFC